MQKIIVLNPKGGSGKTTVAINLASYFAAQGLRPTLMDMDAQGSSTRWLSKRGMEHAAIHGIATYERNSRVTRSFALRIPQGCERVIVDTPAALDPQRMPDITRDAHAIVVPVLPSDIDIHAAAKCITDLLLVAKIPRHEQRIGVIANRVKKNTVMYRALMRFLQTLDIPILTTLRDSQNYVRAAESGIGIFEMKPYQVKEDLEQWLPLLGWLAQKESSPSADLAPSPAATAASAAYTPTILTPANLVAPATAPVPAVPLVDAPARTVTTTPSTWPLQPLPRFKYQTTQPSAPAKPETPPPDTTLPAWFTRQT
jgi:chromosome partitioning protein